MLATDRARGGASSSLQRVQSGIRLGPARRGAGKTPCHRVIGPSSGIARDCSGSHKPVDTQAVPGGPKVGARIADLGRWKCGGRTRGGVESCRRAAAGQDREVEKDWRPTAQEEKQQSNEGSAAQRSAADRQKETKAHTLKLTLTPTPMPTLMLTFGLTHSRTLDLISYFRSRSRSRSRSPLQLPPNC